MAILINGEEMNLEYEFRRFGVQGMQDFTYKGTYVVASLSNLLSEQSYNRGSKRWTKAEYVVLDTSFSGPDQKRTVLEAWRNITKFHDQFFFVPDVNALYTAYDYAARPIGTGTIRDLIIKIKGK